MHGYWRHPTVGLPELVQAEPVAREPAAQMATGEAGTLAPKLERVYALGAGQARRNIAVFRPM